MRILYVSQYFPPEMGAPSARVYELSREWVRQGHEVTVLTAFAHHPTGVKAPEDRYVLSRNETMDGIKVLRTYVYATANKGTTKRMVSYASFMASAIAIGRFQISRPDIVIATSPQLLCGLAGYVLARTLRVPCVFEVRDLWPESVLAVEALQESIVIKALRSLARFLYLRSDRIVTVGEGYRRGIHRRYGISENKIDVIRNGVDRKLFIPLPKDNGIRQEYQWNQRFVVMYVGTHGMAHNLRQILEVARAMQNEPEKLFVFVGEGGEKDELQRLTAEWRLTNVQFIDQQPKSRIPHFYASCDLGLVTLRDSPLFQEVLPSKIFEYMAMARPVLLNVNGEARQLVESASAGVYVPAGDVGAMVAMIRELSTQAERLTEMGQKGREFVLLNHDRGELANQYLKVLAPLLSLKASAKSGRIPRAGDIASSSAVASNLRH
jgi:colanic acid biosynthesis glycosyl transferase WcaI